MYYRRRLLLAIVEKATCQKIDTVSLHHILFLITQQQNSGYFHFVPHTHGCVSFQAERDLDVLSSYYKLLHHTNNTWTLPHSTQNFYSTLTHADQHICTSVLRQFNTQHTNAYVQKVYDMSPYHFIRATNTTLILTPSQQQHQKQERKKITNSTPKLFSIGYQGISIDAYLDKLIRQDIKLLCDVRKNAHSMKYGFSKKRLNHYCSAVGIEYIHIPALGIASEKRKTLAKAADYRTLFQEYGAHIHTKAAELENIQRAITKYNRIALTCFESDHRYCHRGTLMQYYTDAVHKISAEHI